MLGNAGIRTIIRKEKYKSLRDRIVTNYDMRGLDKNEAEEYIRSRLESAG